MHIGCCTDPAVSDVFHTGSPDSALWEFKHGNGMFRRGDLLGLREIKRRASRHALIQRDSFTPYKATASQPGTPAEPTPDADARLAQLEHWLCDMNYRLVRAEEGNMALQAKCQEMAGNLSRCYHVSLLTTCQSMAADQVPVVDAFALSFSASDGTGPR